MASKWVSRNISVQVLKISDMVTVSYNDHGYSSNVLMFVVVIINCRYIVSDCDSVGVLYETQHFTRTPEDAVAATIKAGKLHFSFNFHL